MNTRSLSLLLCSLTLLIAASVNASPPSHTKVPFSSIAPLLKDKCVSCHNAKSHPGKVDLSTYAALMKSGDHGLIVVPGNPNKSKIFLYVNGKKQPIMPMGGKPLKISEVNLLKTWILAGAGK